MEVKPDTPQSICTTPADAGPAASTGFARFDLGAEYRQHPSAPDGW